VIPGGHATFALKPAVSNDMRKREREREREDCTVRPGLEGVRWDLRMVREAWQNIALLYASRRLSSETDADSLETVKITVKVNTGFIVRRKGRCAMGESACRESVETIMTLVIIERARRSIDRDEKNKVAATIFIRCKCWR
jgi:hypothetical protein